MTPREGVGGVTQAGWRGDDPNGKVGSVGGDAEERGCC